MMKEFEEFVFQLPHKGVCLKAYLSIGIGDIEPGLQILKDYTQETQNAVDGMRVKNMKVVKYL